MVSVFRGVGGLALRRAAALRVCTRANSTLTLPPKLGSVYDPIEVLTDDNERGIERFQNMSSPNFFVATQRAIKFLQTLFISTFDADVDRKGPFDTKSFEQGARFAVTRVAEVLSKANSTDEIEDELDGVLSPEVMLHFTNKFSQLQHTFPGGKIQYKLDVGMYKMCESELHMVVSPDHMPKAYAYVTVLMNVKRDFKVVKGRDADDAEGSDTKEVEMLHSDSGTFPCVWTFATEFIGENKIGNWRWQLIDIGLPSEGQRWLPAHAESIGDE